jgi:hypothetical protein
MKMGTEALQSTREAESLIGSPVTQMFMDSFPEHRLAWLREARKILRANGVKPENLDGPWHTE